MEREDKSKKREGEIWQGRGREGEEDEVMKRRG
jgi:hypothetical protein